MWANRSSCSAAAEIRSALERLQAEHLMTRLHDLEQKAREAPLTAEEKQELQALLRTKGQSNRLPSAK
mgnify:CR=1 FL=1